MRIRPHELETSICDVNYHVSLELSVIPRGSWGDVARRFTMIRWGVRLPKSQQGSNCDFPKGEGLNCNFGLGGLKNCFHIIILSFGNCVDRSDLIGDRDYDEASVVLAAETLGRWIVPTETTASSEILALSMRLNIICTNQT
ncbi:hypothetical protein F511_44041 [Dorcoceras hygrometricum]|uniref:Uncharacterized protein n=1 Tax=Dorcoceras hygrometricum TaxID=472368 RepID=A0A2Z7AB28_9LAMI|nr:hypothetical protein F511_44041 [Dorcoceras hygrometricum]